MRNLYIIVACMIALAGLVMMGIPQASGCSSMDCFKTYCYSSATCVGDCVCINHECSSITLQ